MKFTKILFFLIIVAGSTWSGAAEAFFFNWCGIFHSCDSGLEPGSEPDPKPKPEPAANPEYDFVVVGAGAGGGTLASRLAHLGHSVLLIDAGEDTAENNPAYKLPGGHPIASETPGKSWGFYVEHYSDPKRAARNVNAMCSVNSSPKTLVRCDVKANGNCDCPEGTSRKGILYPRGIGIGGSTTNNAMINVLPKNSDWDSLASLTGDHSWSSSHINSTYLPRLYDWASIEQYDADWLLNDVHGKYVQEMVASAVSVVNPPNFAHHKSIVENLNDNSLLDAAVADQNEGMWTFPVAHKNGFRASVRERVLASACLEDFLHPDGLSDSERITQCKNNGLWDNDNNSPLLVIQRNSLVTQVLFDDVDSKKATGVEYVVAKAVYEADKTQQVASGLPRQKAFAAKEVILSAGAYNTPQLLMLSGIGDPVLFEREDINIPLRHALPGVGRNLQDRYEVGMVYEAPNKLKWIDNCLSLWNNLTGQGCFAYLTGALKLNPQSEQSVLSTNFIFTSILTKSSPERAQEDIHIFGLINEFTGYFNGYSVAGASPKRFTWALLKGHTENRGGVITLRTDSPFDQPDIVYNSFEDGDHNTATLSGSSNASQSDLDAIVAGMKVVRNIVQNAETEYGTDYQEIWPGDSAQSDDDLKQAVRDSVWGHHAFSSAAIGTDHDLFAVLDSDFRVRGIDNLRVVDASVFPRHIGTFPVLGIYLMAEKAAAAIDQVH